MSAPTVLVLDDNLFFRPRLQTDLAAHGYNTDFAASSRRFDALIAEPPAIVLVNLAARSIPWAMLVPRFREQYPDVPVVGYGPHVDEELTERGMAAGCDDVVATGTVAAEAAAVVARFLEQA